MATVNNIIADGFQRPRLKNKIILWPHFFSNTFFWVGWNLLQAINKNLKLLFYYKVNIVYKWLYPLCAPILCAPTVCAPTLCTPTLCTPILCVPLFAPHSLRPHILRPTLCALTLYAPFFAPPHFAPHTLCPTLCTPTPCALINAAICLYGMSK